MTIRQIAGQIVKTEKRRGDLALRLLEALRVECKETSQNKVAKRIGVSGAYLSDVLNGRRQGSGVGLAEKIAKAWTK